MRLSVSLPGCQCGVGNGRTIAWIAHDDECCLAIGHIASVTVRHNQTNEPAWPTLRAHLLALAAETGQHPLRHLQTAAAGRDLHTAGDMAAVLYWRLPELTPTNPGPLPWLPGIPPTLRAHPVWGDYLAKRSQLVADLAGQVQAHACQGDAEPIWAAAGTHPSTALIGGIAVWRAANGINPQDPRPTGGTQFESLPALWKQRLDRDVAWATYPAADATADERQAGRTALSRSYSHRQHPPVPTARTASERAIRAPPIAQATVVTLKRPEHEDARHTATAGRSDRSCDPGLAAAR